MPYARLTDEQVRAPIHIWTPSNFIDDAEYWRHIASAFEELSRTCLYCSFMAKHRGSLKRHIDRKHSGGQ